jgi:hypothetical protein
MTNYLICGKCGAKYDYDITPNFMMEIPNWYEDHEGHLVVSNLENINLPPLMVRVCIDCFNKSLKG